MCNDVAVAEAFVAAQHSEHEFGPTVTQLLYQAQCHHERQGEDLLGYLFDDAMEVFAKLPLDVVEALAHHNRETTHRTSDFFVHSCIPARSVVPWKWLLLATFAPLLTIRLDPQK